MLNHTIDNGVLCTEETTISFAAGTAKTYWYLHLGTGFVNVNGRKDEALTHKIEESALLYKAQHYFPKVKATLYKRELMCVRNWSNPDKTRHTWYVKKLGGWQRTSAADFEQMWLEGISYNTHNTHKGHMERRYHNVYHIVWLVK